MVCKLCDDWSLRPRKFCAKYLAGGRLAPVKAKSLPLCPTREPRTANHERRTAAVVPFTIKVARTLLQKVWDAHAVRRLPNGQTQLFVGLHLVHEVTSPQAFDMLRARG